MFSVLWIKKDNIGIGLDILNYDDKISPTIVYYHPLGSKIGSSYRTSEVTAWDTPSFSFKGRIFFNSYYKNRKYDYNSGIYYSNYGEILIKFLEEWRISDSPRIQLKLDTPMGNNFFPEGSVYSNDSWLWLKNFKAPRKGKFTDWSMDVDFDG